MDKYKNNALAEPMDEIILLNENYADQGLRAGYVGTVMENLIEKHGVVIADFSNPVTGDYIRPVAYIKKEDFRVECQCPCDRNSLTLSAGKLARISIFLI